MKVTLKKPTKVNSEEWTKEKSQLKISTPPKEIIRDFSERNEAETIRFHRNKNI